MRDTTAARQAATTQTNLMGETSRLGLSTLTDTLGYARGALARRGLPAYANRAYGAAKTAALEQAQLEQSGLRKQLMTDGAPLETLAGRAGSFLGASGAYAKEAAGIEGSKAMATISQRNQLLSTLMGGGAGGINLSAGFGSLTNRALAGGLDAGNPTYEAVTGGLATGVPLLLTALSRTQNPLVSAGGNLGEA